MESKLFGLPWKKTRDRIKSKSSRDSTESKSTSSSLETERSKSQIKKKWHLSNLFHKSQSRMSSQHQPSSSNEFSHNKNEPSLGTQSAYVPMGQLANVPTGQSAYCQPSYASSSGTVSANGTVSAYCSAKTAFGVLPPQQNANQSFYALPGSIQQKPSNSLMGQIDGDLNKSYSSSSILNSTLLSLSSMSLPSAHLEEVGVLPSQPIYAPDGEVICTVADVTSKCTKGYAASKFDNGAYFRLPAADSASSSTPSSSITSLDDDEQSLYESIETTLLPVECALESYITPRDVECELTTFEEIAGLERPARFQMYPARSYNDDQATDFEVVHAEIRPAKMRMRTRRAITRQVQAQHICPVETRKRTPLKSQKSSESSESSKLLNSTKLTGLRKQRVLHTMEKSQKTIKKLERTQKSTKSTKKEVERSNKTTRRAPHPSKKSEMSQKKTKPKAVESQTQVVRTKNVIIKDNAGRARRIVAPMEQPTNDNNILAHATEAHIAVAPSSILIKAPDKMTVEQHAELIKAADQIFKQRDQEATKQTNAPTNVLNIVASVEPVKVTPKETMRDTVEPETARETEEATAMLIDEEKFADAGSHAEPAFDTAIRMGDKTARLRDDQDAPRTANETEERTAHWFGCSSPRGNFDMKDFEEPQVQKDLKACSRVEPQSPPGALSTARETEERTAEWIESPDTCRRKDFDFSDPMEPLTAREEEETTACMPDDDFQQMFRKHRKTLSRNRSLAKSASSVSQAMKSSLASGKGKPGQRVKSRLREHEGPHANSSKSGRRHTKKTRSADRKSHSKTARESKNAKQTSNKVKRRSRNRRSAPSHHHPKSSKTKKINRDSMDMSKPLSPNVPRTAKRATRRSDSFKTAMRKGMSPDAASTWNERTALSDVRYTPERTAGSATFATNTHDITSKDVLFTERPTAETTFNLQKTAVRKTRSEDGLKTALNRNLSPNALKAVTPSVKTTSTVNIGDKAPKETKGVQAKTGRTRSIAHGQTEVSAQVLGTCVEKPVTANAGIRPTMSTTSSRDASDTENDRLLLRTARNRSPRTAVSSGAPAVGTRSNASKHEQRISKDEHVFMTGKTPASVLDGVSEGTNPSALSNGALRSVNAMGTSKENKATAGTVSKEQLKNVIPDGMTLCEDELGNPLLMSLKELNKMDVIAEEELQAEEDVMADQEVKEIVTTMDTVQSEEKKLPPQNKAQITEVTIKELQRVVVVELKEEEVLPQLTQGEDNDVITERTISEESEEEMTAGLDDKESDETVTDPTVYKTVPSVDQKTVKELSEEKRLLEVMSKAMDMIHESNNVTGSNSGYAPSPR